MSKNADSVDGRMEGVGEVRVVPMHVVNCRLSLLAKTSTMINNESSIS